MARYVEPHDEAWVEITRIEFGGRWVSPQLETVEFGENVIRGDERDVTTLQRAFEEWLASDKGDPEQKLPGTYRVVASWQYSGLVASVAQFHVTRADLDAIREQASAAHA